MGLKSNEVGRSTIMPSPTRLHSNAVGRSTTMPSLLGSNHDLVEILSTSHGYFNDNEMTTISWSLSFPCANIAPALLEAMLAPP